MLITIKEKIIYERKYILIVIKIFSYLHNIHCVINII